MSEPSFVLDACVNCAATPHDRLRKAANMLSNASRIHHKKETCAKYQRESLFMLMILYLRVQSADLAAGDEVLLVCKLEQWAVCLRVVCVHGANGEVAV